MIPERPVIEHRILAALNATPARIPVLLGGCGTGRTSLLRRVSQHLGDRGSHYFDIERAASTPEGFCTAVMRDSPYMLRGSPGQNQVVDFKGSMSDARTAFETLVRYLQESVGPSNTSPIFLIDEILELRTFESFPGLRGVVREIIDAFTKCSNRFVLTTRYASRAHRLFRDASARFEVIYVPMLSPVEVAATLMRHGVGRDDAERNDLSRMIHALTNGRPIYVRTLTEALRSMDGASSGDPVSALASQLEVDAPLWLVCRFSYELRLHRARGYGALKAILQILAKEEPFTLTEIAHRLRRTPGSTKDYLTWLEDVDLISVRKKRYSFADPLLRLWVRLYCRPASPTEEELSREVQEYAVLRLPFMEPSPLPSGTRRVTEPIADDKAWSIIEID